MNRLCPACWQPVDFNHAGIETHLDSIARTKCEGSGLPYRTTLPAVGRTVAA